MCTGWAVGSGGVSTSSTAATAVEANQNENNNRNINNLSTYIGIQILRTTIILSNRENENNIIKSCVQGGLLAAVV